MAHASEVFIFISGSRIDKDSNTGEVPWQGFCRNSYAIRQGRDLVELCWILYSVSTARKSGLGSRSTFCIGSTTVARPLERKEGEMTLGNIGLFGNARVNALDEEHFNMMDSCAD